MPDESASTPAAPPRRPILVVDDEPEMLFSLRNLLRREFEVHTASSGVEGIKVLQEHVIHLVMTDQRMPQMTGVELLRRVKNEHPAAMRLIFTGYADVQAVIAAINQGNVFKYVTKPWDPEDLLAALREAGKRYDQIVRRNHLLLELRTHQSRQIEFKDGLLTGRFGPLSPEGITQSTELLQSSQDLLTRLDESLSATLHEPMA